jgi:hypothetical protein
MRLPLPTTDLQRDSVDILCGGGTLSLVKMRMYARSQLNRLQLSSFGRSLLGARSMRQRLGRFKKSR